MACGHLLSTLLLLLPGAAGAVEIDLAPSALRWVVALDHYTPDGAADALGPVIQRSHDELQQQGMTGISTSRSESGGIGIRVGFLVDPENPFGAVYGTDPSPYQAGLSLSAVSGPRFEATQSFTDPVNGPGSNHYESQSHFFRLLLEGQARRPLGSVLRATAGAALGVGLGLTACKNLSKGSGVQPGIPPTNHAKDHTIRPTWELTAALSYPAPSMEFQVGVRYAAFPPTPRRNKAAELLPVDWKPFGLFLAVLF